MASPQCQGADGDQGTLPNACPGTAEDPRGPVMGPQHPAQIRGHRMGGPQSGSGQDECGGFWISPLSPPWEQPRPTHPSVCPSVLSHPGP